MTPADRRALTLDEYEAFCGYQVKWLDAQGG
jgi:hypothetical protein